METPSFEVLRSPFDNVMSFITTLPQGHEKAFKQALYNAIAIFILFVVCAAGWALYVILEPFMKPLFWALLCGACLYPFKYYLTTTLQSWIGSMKSTTDVVISLVLIPPTAIDDISEKVGSLLRKYLIVILGLAGTIIVIHLLYSYTPIFFTCFVWRIGLWTTSLTKLLIEMCSISVVVAAFIGYVIIVIACWEHQTSSFFFGLSYFLWLVLSSFLASFSGNFQILIFVSLQLFWVLGFFYEAWTIQSSMQNKGEEITFAKAVKLAASNEDFTQDENTSNTQEQESDKIKTDVSQDNAEAEQEVSTGTTKKESFLTPPPALLIKNKYVESFKQPKQLQPEFSTTTSESLESDKYLYGVMWACVFMLFWKYLWLLNLIPVLIVYYFIKHSGHAFGLWSWISSHINHVYYIVLDWFKVRKSAFLPPPLRGHMKIKHEVDISILDALKGSIDSAASTVVILGLLSFLLFALAFLFFQMYTELIFAAQVTASVINSTVLQNDMLLKYLPEDWQDQVNNALDNVYQQGRDGISNLVRVWLKDAEQTKAAQLEQQVLELWDRVYQAWMMSSVEQPPMGPTVTSGAVLTSWDGLMENFYKMPELFNWKQLLQFAQDNVETLMSVLDSVWIILKGNIGMAFYSVTSFTSIIFGGGTAVLNFLLNMVVFLTALFYLLNCSTTLYKPVEMITNMSPSHGNKIAIAMQEAITGVFTASFKMALFYGLWTWFVHNLFGVEIVYLPSVVAAVFGAVPFLGTYWVCVPTAMVLWLYHGSPILAVFLFLFHFLPCSTINTVFYGEIKGGGHPYLTGLAVAGGLFCLGAEGAILGPLILCCLLAAFNISGSLMKDSPSDHLLGQINQARSRRTIN